MNGPFYREYFATRVAAESAATQRQGEGFVTEIVSRTRAGGIVWCVTYWMAT